MRRRLTGVGVIGVMLALNVAACGDSSRQKGIDSDHPAGGASGRGGTGGDGSPASLHAPAADLPAGSMCEPSGWCWYDPLPTGAAWFAVAGAGRTQVWLGGDSPNLLRLNGGRWTQVVSPLSHTDGIWASSENDVWFGGAIADRPDGLTTAALAHWNGSALTLAARLGQGIVTDVWGSSASDVYAVGFDFAQHWDGSAWTAVPGVIGTSVSGSGPNDVWIGATNGLFRFDGNVWSHVPEFEGVFVLEVSVAGPGDVWAATSGVGIYSIQHFDGTNWSLSLQVPVAPAGIYGVHASSSGSVWVYGNEFVPDGPIRGYLNHFDGSQWTRAPLAPTGMLKVRNVAGHGDIGVGWDGGLLQLTAVPTPQFTDLRTGPAEFLRGTFGTSPTDMWAVGDNGSVLHYDGKAVAQLPAGTSANLADVWGTAPDDVWAVGEGGTVLHFDGSAFTPLASGTSANLNAVFTARRNDVWIGGDGGTLLHWDGTAFTSVPLPAGLDPASPIRDIHGLGPDDIWLGGGGVSPTFDTLPGFVLHFDGIHWSVPAPFDPALSYEAMVQVWELAPNDVWVATDRTQSGGIHIIWHFDGVAWTGSGVLATEAPYVFPNLNTGGGSFVFGPHDRWIVGFMGLWQRSTQ